jgi:hypothetical protein
MASGRMYLKLSQQVSWHSFPEFAKLLMPLVRGRILSKADLPDMRVWEVEIHGHKVWLAYQDFPEMVSLEPRDDLGEAVVKQLFTTLRMLSDSGK